VETYQDWLRWTNVLATFIVCWKVYLLASNFT